MFRTELVHHDMCEHQIVIPNITAPMFDLVLRFLYGNPFENWKYALNVEAKSEEPNTDALRPACEMLCFTLKYDFVELKNHVASHIRDAKDVDYKSLLAAAKFVYTNASEIEPWFRELVWNKTREALAADLGLADEIWFTEIFEHGHNGLSKDIFECYKSIYRGSIREIDTPISDIVSVPGTGLSIDTEDEILPSSSFEVVDIDYITVPEEAVAPEHAIVLDNPVVREDTVVLDDPIAPEYAAVLDDPVVREDAVVLDDPVAPEYAAVLDDPIAPEYTAVLDDAVVPEEVMPEEAMPEETVQEEAMLEKAIAQAPSAYGRLVSGILKQPNRCVLRRYHLQEKSRWENCSICMQEVVVIARSASRGSGYTTHRPV